MNLRLIVLSLLLGAVTVCEAGWKAGVAQAVITPDASMWMAGFAARIHPSDGKLHDLKAKALALQDDKGKKVVLVTLDLLGLPKPVSDAIRDQVQKQFGLSREQIILNSSHTHSGPVIAQALTDIYPLTGAEDKKISAYTEQLKLKLVQLVGQALNNLKPAKLASAKGVTRFQVNRRNNDANTLERLTELEGPNDFAVPVIRISDDAGKMVAVVFGYACHPTVLDGYNWSGDYPGYAQIELEKLYPGTTALFFQGAGADQNPLPRHTVPLAIQYGKTLAAAVERTLSEEMTELSPEISATYTEVDLALTAPPTEQQLKKYLQTANGFQKRWAERMLSEVSKGTKFPSSYPYPVQAWKLGNQPIIALGGELVVQYAIELKKIFGQHVFVMGYSNDVMTYIPSGTILREGGYEGEVAQIVYGLPSTWAPDIESKIISTATLVAEKAGIQKPLTGLFR